jgi:hypothetical protein
MRVLPVLMLASVQFAHAAAPSDPVGSPKAARTVGLAYQIGEADVFYIEMVVQKTTDGSFFLACGWDNGYLGLQQYDGPDKRAVIFTAWKGVDEDNPAASKAAGPVEILDWTIGGKTNAYGPQKLGAQYMRQIDWRVGETNRFVLDAVRSGPITTYSAWLQRPGSAVWDKLATFRGYSGSRWLRGFHSFIEDFRRDTESAKQTRRARFGNVWIHQFNGSWVSAPKAVFVASASPSEAADKIDAGTENGAFFLSTGGETTKHSKVGEAIVVPEPVAPFKLPEEPKLLFLKLNKPKP